MCLNEIFFEFLFGLFSSRGLPPIFNYLWYMELDIGQISALYGEQFFLLQDEEAEGVSPKETATPVPVDAPVPAEEGKATPPDEGSLKGTGNLNWRPKPNSQVLFVLHQSELQDKALTDLLKNIVQSIEIPFESAGFGIVTGAVNQADFEDMPNPFAVVFDQELNWTKANPVAHSKGSLYFTHRLAELTKNREFKMALWQQLQVIKSKIS